MISLPLVRRRLADSGGPRSWTTEVSSGQIDGSSAAIVLCDVWDRHWSSGATRRVEALVPRLDQLCRRLRGAGVLVVHAPSDTMDYYRDAPARRRIAHCAISAAPMHPDLPPLPFDVNGGGSDTEDTVPADSRVWSRQHSGIAIDQTRDVITDLGGELATYLRQDARQTIFMAGVHANLCILRRSFGLPALIGYGFSPVLVSDLTDAMYDPAYPPYVDHDAGTELVIGYIQAFVAPTTRSDQMMILRDTPSG